MSAIFGIMGTATAAERAEMARRLAHRGKRWIELQPAADVWLGQGFDGEAVRFESGPFAGVFDLSRALADPPAASALLAAWEAGGAAALARLDCAFAFALWNSHTQSLLIGRDPAGLKPLYVTRLSSGGLAFATEYKALLSLAEVPAEADLDALQFLQVHKLTPPGARTLLKGIEAARANSVVEYARDGSTQHVYPMPEVRLEIMARSDEAAAKQLREHLIAAVKRLTGNRTRIALALSGGVDSLGLAHLCRTCAPAADLIGYTFTQGHDDPEIQAASTAMRVLGGRLETINMTGDALAARLPEAVWHLEDPVGRTESLLFFEVARRARDQGAEVLLSGMGADALFAGMPRYKVLWLATLFPWLRTDLLEFYDATQTGQVPRRLLARLLSLSYFRGPVPQAPRILGARWPAPENHPAPGPEYVNRALIGDVLDHAARSLPRIERPLYAYGLEHGSPFLDRAVIDFSFTLSDRHKLRGGREKIVLREALQPIMSHELRHTHKGLMRMRQDERFSRALDQLGNAYLTPEAIRRRGYFEPEQIAALRLACRSPQAHHEKFMRLWTVLLTEIWARTFVDGRGRAQLDA